MILWVTDAIDRKKVAIPIDMIIRFMAVDGNHTQTVIELMNGQTQECEENIVPLVNQFTKLKEESVGKA